MATFLPVILVGGLILLFASVRIIKEYERGVIYTLGKYDGMKEAGIRLVLPAIQQMKIIDVRVRTEEIPAQDLISKDNVSVRVSAVLNYRVVHLETPSTVWKILSIQQHKLHKPLCVPCSGNMNLMICCKTATN